MDPEAKPTDALLDEAIELLGQRYETNASFNEYFDADEPIEV